MPDPGGRGGSRRWLDIGTFALGILTEALAQLRKPARRRAALADTPSPVRMDAARSRRAPGPRRRPPRGPRRRPDPSSSA